MTTWLKMTEVAIETPEPETYNKAFKTVNWWKKCDADSQQKRGGGCGWVDEGTLWQNGNVV